MTHHLGRSALGLLTAVAMAGCGGAPAPAAQSAPTENVDDLANALESAERELYQNLASPPPQATGTLAAEQPDEGAAAPAPEQEGEPDAEAKPEPRAQRGPSTEAQKPTDCTTACKALGSMKRSADRICQLAGESHERCVWANARVAEALKRIEQAGCTCSED